MLAVPAHAKVNLALEIAGRRPDGYHDLVTVFATLDWHDVVLVTLQGGSAHDSVEVHGPTAHVAMAAPDALLARSAAEVRGLVVAAAAGATPDVARIAGSLDVRVHVEKRLPVAAGLGGGSADAAAVLRAGALEVERLLGIRIDGAALLEAAARLGADVPAVLVGGTTLARGRGEVLEALPGAPRLHLAVAIPAASSTAAVYAALTDEERRPDGRALRVAAALRAGRSPEAADCGSALEPPAARVSAELAASLAALRRDTGLRWALTGSGGAVFELAESAETAAAAAAAARRHGHPARACRTLPVPLAEPAAHPDGTPHRPTIAR